MNDEKAWSVKASGLFVLEVYLSVSAFEDLNVNFGNVAFCAAMLEHCQITVMHIGMLSSE